MKFSIIIPAHNEAEFIKETLHSLVHQTHLPDEVIVVDDNSSDETSKIVETFTNKYDFVKLVHHASSNQHIPGSKIIKAFYRGYETVTTNFDIICKFDADLIFPKNYLFEVKEAFIKNPKLGMFAGFCYTKEEDRIWKKEQLTNNDHIRGPLKAYRKECFEDIGGLKKEMGWDTVDELLARYHGWQTQTDEDLHVKHLKPTGKLYSSSLAKRYGIALYKMDYGFWLSLLSLLKLAFLKKQVFFILKGMTSFLKTAIFQKPTKMVHRDEGKYIRNYRWEMIKKKLGI